MSLNKIQTSDPDKEASSPADDPDQKRPERVSEIDKVPVFMPPDGGYGWVVVFISFLTHVLADGIIFTFGIFYLEFLDYFEAGKGLTASLGSLLSGICLLSAPIAAALVNTYGCKPVVIWGSVLSFVSFMVCTLSPNIEFMMFTYGFCGGFSLGLMYLPMVIAVSYYFDRKRAIATGIAVCGSGVGVFIFAPFGRWLLSIYDWKNSMYILAALTLNGIVFGSLLRPVAPVSAKSDVPEGFTVTEAEKKSENGLTITTTASPSSDPVKHKDDIALLKRSNPGETRSTRTLSASASGDLKAVPLFRKDIFLSSSIQNIPEYEKSQDLVGYTRKTTSYVEFQEPQNNVDVIEIQKYYICGCIPVSKQLKDTLKQMTDVSLLRDPQFLLICLANFFGSLGVYIPFVYIADRAIGCGISPNEAAILLSLIGLCNTFGRIISGALANMKWVNTLLFHNVAVTMAGVICLLNMFFVTFKTICIFVVIFGLCFATWISVTPPILCSLVGLERLTNAFGLLVMSRGLATLIGTPLAGFVFDVSQDFDVTFHIGGALLMAGGITGFLLHCPCIKKKNL